MPPRYTIRWLKDDTVVAERRTDDFLDAKHIAQAQLPVQKVRKGATTAIVLDDQGAEHLRIPSRTGKE